MPKKAAAVKMPKKKPAQECEHHNPPKACLRCRRLTELREPGALTNAVIRCLWDWLGHSDLTRHDNYCDCPRCESRLLIRLLGAAQDTSTRRHSPNYACGADDCLTCAEARARQDKALLVKCAEAHRLFGSPVTSCAHGTPPCAACITKEETSGRNWEDKIP